MSIWKNGKLIAGGRQCMPLLSFVWADHILDEVSWLRADTFSWHTGNETTGMYPAVYQHLATDIDGKTLQSETVGSTTIQFYLADDGHKICPASEENNVMAIYNATGVAWYYIIDTVNERFKLPRKHSQQIVRSVKNADGSWYRLYADGWVEQGGLFTDNSGSGSIEYDVVFPIVMATNTYITSGFTDEIAYDSTSPNYPLFASQLTTTGMKFKAAWRRANYRYHWGIKGYSAIDMSLFQDGEKHLYFYMGQFTQTALENTAGITAETLNDKADTDLTNAAPNASASAKSTIVGWSMPDYSTGTTATQGTEYTATENCYLYARVFCGGTGSNQHIEKQIIINGIVVAQPRAFYYCADSVMVPCAKGSTYKFENVNTGVGSYDFKVYRCIGG